MMANQSLKDQIEAAKSALAQDPVSAMPAVEPPVSLTSAAMSQARDGVPAAPQTPAKSQAAQAVTEDGFANRDDITALANQVTMLEDQLASNQRDLQTLIRKIREITRVQQHGTGATNTKTVHAARRKWRKFISAVIAITAGSAIAGAYVLTSEHVAVVTADLYALFSGVVQQLGQLAGLK